MQMPRSNPSSQSSHSVTRYRAIWISDFHLGTAGCKAEQLLDFLKRHDADTIYLVGDIVDGWRLRKRWTWPQSHNDVVQKLLYKVRKGTRVVYVPGNHDEFARQYKNHVFGGIEVCLETEHTTADGKRLWITHGDQFDGVIQYAKWLAYLGDQLYTLVLALNHWLNRLRNRLGMRYWSLSQYLKYKVKDAVAFITAFEQVLINEARRKGYDGVVCGHIHKAELREVDGILYCNDGDWVESLTALVERSDGSLAIVDWAVSDTIVPIRPASQQDKGKQAA
ncbi:UDP-2,3-diacylglucosamine diphosphatase [Paracandidimonas soli]|uniref:UDP-2,3-diacylglucosamine diphosphatase n=1 Tax=Paracandidimonas soli TaxID=1917182 RepID=UPI003DA72033